MHYVHILKPKLIAFLFQTDVQQISLTSVFLYILKSFKEKVQSKVSLMDMIYIYIFSFSLLYRRTILTEYPGKIRTQDGLWSLGKLLLFDLFCFLFIFQKNESHLPSRTSYFL